MKCGARVALGVAGGYALGRTKKMKLALMLGGMAAGRRAGGPGELLAQGQKLLSSSPELSALTDQIRGRLLDAGKGAVMAVAARQVSSLTDKVGKRVESLGDLGGGAAGSAKKAAGGAKDAVDPRAADDSADEPDDDATDEPDDEAAPEDVDEEGGEAGSEPTDEATESDEAPAEEPEEAPRPRRRTAAKAREGSGSSSGTGRRTAAAGTRTARNTTAKASSTGTKAARSGTKAAASGTAAKATGTAAKAAPARKARRRSSDA
jgi:hypothetical protein